MANKMHGVREGDKIIFESCDTRRPSVPIHATVAYRKGIYSVNQNDDNLPLPLIEGNGKPYFMDKETLEHPTIIAAFDRRAREVLEGRFE